MLSLTHNTRSKSASRLGEHWYFGGLHWLFSYLLQPWPHHAGFAPDHAKVSSNCQAAAAAVAVGGAEELHWG